MRFLLSILLNGLFVLISAKLLSGVAVDGYVTAIIVGVVLGLVNAFIKPVLTILTLPITVVTLGLFLLVINGLMVLAVDALIPGFAVDGLLWAIGFSLLLTVLNGVLGISDRKETK